MLASVELRTNERNSVVTTELRVYNYEVSGLTPAAGGDQNMVIIIRQMFKGLVESDAQTGVPVNLIADAIESSDNSVWTVTIKEGFRFHNGEPVTADSFIDAWNYAAYAPNAQTNGWAFDRIAGYQDLRADANDDPKASVLSGLRKLDDHRFEVTLRAPYSGFRSMLAHSAFCPLPKVCFEDIAAYETHPIGNGPYRLETWEPNDRVVLSRADDWGGEPGKTDQIVFVMYPTLAAGYAGFEAGEHDLMDNVPAESYKRARLRYPDTIFEQASNSFTYLGVPMYVSEFEHALVRQALSLAIDRQAIIDEVWDGQYLPASTILSPNFPGYREGAGQYCSFDPERAKALLDRAGGWSGGTLKLHANLGGGHEPWLKLVGEEIREHLGIDYELCVDKEFADYFQQAKDKGYDGLFRRAWAPDYAAAASYLGPILVSSGSVNQMFYDNPAFDELVAKADRAPTESEGLALYQQAEDVALEDMAIIPLWFHKTSVLYGKRVTTYVRNIINGSDYAQIQVADRNGFRHDAALILEPNDGRLRAITHLDGQLAVGD